MTIIALLTIMAMMSYLAATARVCGFQGSVARNVPGAELRQITMYSPE
jgi:hypothetical protein